MYIPKINMQFLITWLLVFLISNWIESFSRRWKVSGNIDDSTSSSSCAVSEKVVPLLAMDAMIKAINYRESPDLYQAGRDFVQIFIFGDGHAMIKAEAIL